MVDVLPAPRPAEALAPAPRAPVPAAVPTDAPALRYTWLICTVVLLLAVVAERWLLSQHSFPGDPWAARIGMSPKPWPVWDITRIYQQVGRPLVAVGEVAVMLAWLWRRAGWRETQGLLIVLLASVTCGVIKILCGPTPLWMRLAHHVGTNFPSGVVTFMTATVGYVALVAWRRGRRLVPAALIVAIAGAGPARVLGGQHLISDVLGAYLLGAAWLVAGNAYLTLPLWRRRLQATWAIPRLDTLD